MSFPKAPKPKQVNPFEGMTSDPKFAEAAGQLGYTTVNKDHEVAEVRTQMTKNTVADERRDPYFRKAERQLYREGILTTNDPFYDKQSWKAHYIDKNNLTGKKAKKQANQAYRAEVAEGGKNFMHVDDTDTDWELQKIYNRAADIETKQENKKYNSRLEKRADKFLRQQEKTAKENRELMEELMNQPMYQPRQAAMPSVQYKAKTPDPMPVAPAPPPTMNITPAPAPELVNMGNPMGIVKQSKTARSRSRQRTRGTSSLS